MGWSGFLSTELVAFVRRACAHCLSGGRYTWPMTPRRRVSSRKAPHPGQTPSSSHPGKAARMRQAAAAGTSALRPRGWTPASGNNSSEAERGSETEDLGSSQLPLPQQASSAHSWSLAGHLLAGLCLTPWQWRGLLVDQRIPESGPSHLSAAPSLGCPERKAVGAFSSRVNEPRVLHEAPSTGKGRWTRSLKIRGHNSVTDTTFCVKL